MKPHRRAWTKRHGPIPKGKHIHHIDGDHSNNSIDNLICVSREMHAAIHKEQFEMFDNPKDAYAHNRLTLGPKISGFKRKGGWKLSDETKQRMSEAKKGWKKPPLTTEAKNRISASLTGRKSSDQAKKNISDAMSGEKHPMHGRKHSEATKIKMRESRLTYLKKEKL